MFANAVVDPKPRDTNPADLDTTQSMLHRMEPTWLFIRNHNLAQQHEEQLSRYEDSILKLRQTVEACDDTIKRLRVHTRDFQAAVDRGMSDEQVASRRKNIDNQNWPKIGRAVVRAYDSVAAEADRPPTELPDQFLSARVVYSSRSLCHWNKIICQWDQRRHRPTCHPRENGPGRKLRPRGHSPTPPVCPFHNCSQ